jgi:hypothetical protein
MSLRKSLAERPLPYWPLVHDRPRDMIGFDCPTTSVFMFIPGWADFHDGDLSKIVRTKSASEALR